jgi:NAD(P)-dependent dehydrogenase (short-subunit alcohol dehydrogenase family)
MAVIIIGGTGGVGLELAKSLLLRNVKVSVAGRNIEALTLFITEHGIDSERYILYELDLRNLDSVYNFMELSFDKFNDIDTMVCYAGVTFTGGVMDCDENVFDHIFSVNVKSTFFLCQIFIKKIIKHENLGHIIFTGSSHMYSGEKDRGAYAVSKGSLEILMNNIVRNFSVSKIRTNMVLMGWTLTEGEIELRKENGDDLNDLLSAVQDCIPLGNDFIKVNDLVTVYEYLILDSPKVMSGSIIKVSGGEII